MFIGEEECDIGNVVWCVSDIGEKIYEIEFFLKEEDLNSLFLVIVRFVICFCFF